MLTLDDIKDFKIEKRKIILPKPEGNIGNLIFLPYLTPKKCGKAIKTMSTLFVRQANWKYIYRDYKYAFKLFNKHLRYNNLRERDTILDDYEEEDKSLKGVKNFSLAKSKNCFIDLSHYMNNFFNFKRYSWKMTINEFFRLFSEVTHKEEYNSFNKKIILLNINEWEIDKSDVVNKYNILNNPFSILYLAMRKDVDVVKMVGDCTIVITDGKQSFFKFDPSKLDKYSYLDFKLAISKIKADLLDKDLDNDAHLSEYGTTSSNAPKEELEKSKAQLAADNDNSSNINNEEQEKKSLLDRIHDMDGTSHTDEEEEEEPEEEPEVITSDDEEKSSDEKDTRTDEEKERELVDELIDELNTDETTIEDIQEILAKKVPDRPVSAREKKLKEEQLKIKLESGKTLAEVMDDVKNNPSYKNIPVTDVSDKVNTLNSRLTKVKYPNFEKAYNDEVFEKDFYSIFNSLSERKDLPVYIRKVTKEDTSDTLNLKETYKFELEDTVYGRRHTFTIDVPKFIEGKYMYLGGNKKIFIKQLILKPIVKIAPDTVQICSNYSKIFMYRYGDKVSPKMENLINVISNDNKHFTCKLGNSNPFNTSYKTSIEYDILAKKFLSVKVKGSDTIFIFSQELVNEFAETNNIDIAKIDRDKELIVGFRKENGKYKVMTVDSDEAVIAATGFGNGEDVDPAENTNSNKSLVDFIINEVKAVHKDYDIDKAFGDVGAKIGKRYIYSRCKIMKKFVPTVLLLSYCEGLTTVLRKAKVNYTFQQTRPKFEGNADKLSKGVIPFADGYLVFDRYPIQNSLLMNSFTLIDTRAYKFEDMDVKGTYLDIFGILYDSRIIASAFDSFYDNMIDPITKELLDGMNYPTDFVNLLLVANLLLADNNFSSEIDMNNFRVRSNEMVNAMLYKIVANAFSKYKRTAHNKTPIKISVPPTALLKEIVTSQSVEDYSILNPIVETEKSRAITAKGPSGINLDQSYTEEKRSFDKTMIGLMAMSTSPDANCGVVRELTVDPKIVSPRGFIDTSLTNDQLGDANLFSMAEMLTPLGVNRDDSIRTAMNSKQSKHIIPVAKMDPVLVSNGAEKVLPYHLTSDFTIVAKHDGVVEKIDEKNKLMVLKYTYKENGKVVTQHQVVNFAPQVSKNGAGGFFLANSLRPYVKLGQKFKANEVLAANDKFFDKYSDGVKFNLGTLCKVACMSAYNTFEDSTIVSTRLSHKMASDITMEKHLVLGPNANIIKLVKPGDKVNVNDVIAEYDQSNDEEAINKLLANIADDLKEDVSNMSKNKIVAKYSGYISDVKVYSASEIGALSPSLQKVVSEYWKGVADKKKLLKQYSISDPSLTGNLFMDADGPIKPVNGKIKGFDVEEGVLIFIYITYHNPFSIGDKLTNFGPLKGVCTEIMEPGKEFYSEYRPKEEISSIFPPGGMLGRMVPSVLPTMFCNKLLIELKRQLGEIYLGSYDYEQDFDGHLDDVPDKTYLKQR